jgi:hypothetical protein
LFSGLALQKGTNVSTLLVLNPGDRNSLIRLPQQTLQTQQHALHIVDRTPLVLQDVQADSATEIDVWVVDGCLEEDSGWRVRVVWWEGEGELEGEARVGRFCGTDDGRGPMHEVAVGVGEGGDTGSRGEHEGH